MCALSCYTLYLVLGHTGTWYVAVVVVVLYLHITATFCVFPELELYQLTSCPRSPAIRSYRYQVIGPRFASVE